MDYMRPVDNGPRYDRYRSISSPALTQRTYGRYGKDCNSCSPAPGSLEPETYSAAVSMERLSTETVSTRKGASCLTSYRCRTWNANANVCQIATHVFTRTLFCLPPLTQVRGFRLARLL